ncbi:MAG: TonB-dependent receptor, partial [Rikenellaceae bacterium]|nr:TonB-dependent receptor [Rikenellaceae bacterium]
MRPDRILRGSYSSGYRGLLAYDEDLHVEAVGGKVALIELDPDLKPEYSNSFSASTDFYRRWGSVHGNLLVEGFYTNLRDAFKLEGGETTDAQGNWLYTRVNSGGAIVKGINTELALNWPKIGLQMGYTLQNSKYKEPEEIFEDLEPQRQMPRTPDHYGYLLLNYTPCRNFTASVTGNYSGRMFVPHAATDFNENEIVKSEEFFDAGFKLAYTFSLTSSISLELHGGMKNVFDQYQKQVDAGETKDAGFIYGPNLPRTFFFGMKFSL